MPAVPSDLYPTIPHIDTNARDSTVSFLDRQEVMLISNVENFQCGTIPFTNAKVGKVGSTILVLFSLNGNSEFSMAD